MKLNIEHLSKTRAEETLQLLPDFINDIRALIEKVKNYE